ncbi:MAG: MBL fold metallo-hydrolase [Candidatus Hodarchaeota archaeon]
MLNYTQLCNNIYLTKERKKRFNLLNSIVIEENKNSGAVLIDTNYPFGVIDHLYTRIKSPAKALIFSHCHTDHMAHGFYHQEKYHTPLYCPVQEKDYILSIDSLIENNGFKKLGLKEQYVKMVQESMKFKEAKSVNIFNPGHDVLEYSSVELETIHIPGHSPGHTAFLIRSIQDEENRKVLYVSDIGSHPYYGDLNCDLREYRKSIAKLEQIYLSDDYILVPAHGTVYIKKNEEFFERIRARIRVKGEKVLSNLSKTKSKSIKELVFEGTLSDDLEQMEQLYKDLHLLWDGGEIHQHLLEFIAQGIVEKTKEVDFLNDKYILV